MEQKPISAPLVWVVITVLFWVWMLILWALTK